MSHTTAPERRCSRPFASSSPSDVLPRVSICSDGCGGLRIRAKNPCDRFPVCRQGAACDGPAQVTLVFSRSGRDVARTRSTPAGRYRIALTPGYYAVRTLERIGISPNIRPANVHVRTDRFDRLNFSIDTGIR